jgi:hypothetical protein
MACRENSNNKSYDTGWAFGLRNRKTMGMERKGLMDRVRMENFGGVRSFGLIDTVGYLFDSK